MKFKTVQQAFFLLLLFLPVVTLAQFRTLVGIPGLADPSTDFNTYINILYALSISVAALLAVIKIIIAGVKYMLSDLVSSKEEAKSDIQGALIGLLIVVSAVLILNVINPQLTETRLFIAPVTQVSVNNSALGTRGGGGGASAPLPSATSTQAANPSRPVAVREMWCAREESLKHNCTAAIASCVAAGGVHEPDSWYHNQKDITCRFGRETPVRCAGGFDSLTGEVYNVDCTAARAACAAPKIFTPPAANQLGASCFTPNPKP